MNNKDGSTQEPRDLCHNLRFECRNLSEEFYGRIRHLLKVHKIDVRIVNPTPLTIKQYASQKQKNVVACTMRKRAMKIANVHHVTSCTKVCMKYVIPAMLGQQGDRYIQDARNTLEPR